MQGVPTAPGTVNHMDIYQPVVPFFYGSLLLASLVPAVKVVQSRYVGVVLLQSYRLKLELKLELELELKRLTCI